MTEPNVTPIMEKHFADFKEEAELFFVKKMESGKRIERVYSFCLDVIFRITGNSDIDYTKGVISFNPRYGQGKSFFFEVAHHRYRRLYNKNLFKMSSAKELVKVFKEGGEDALLEYIKVRNLFIDDIGDEGDDKEFWHYKEKLNVIRYVLLKRYEMWSRDRNYRTFGTTNLTIAQISKQYDGRVSDRLMEMVYFQEFDFLEDDQSFRQISSSRKLTEQEKRENYLKVRPEVKVVAHDLTKFINGLLSETDDYLNVIGETDWNIVKRFMFEHDYLKAEDFAGLTDDMIDAGMLKARYNIKQGIKVTMRNCAPVAINNRIDESIKKLTREDGQSIAENVIVRKKFFEYRANPDFKFTIK